MLIKLIEESTFFFIITYVFESNLSKFGTLEGLVTALFDEWTFMKKKREIYIAILFFICFLIGLSNVTEVSIFLKWDLAP